ncbi:hypothetical protein F4818DRAFT_454197 [Hypoxylon cercidicola]|nr:hypothetical protein F4818DRAFT_454197 [Hypoxylon cercidicola]
MSSPIPIPTPTGSRRQDPEPADQEAKPRWSEIEDKILKQGVAQHGVDNWEEVAKMIWTRKDAEQCRARWAELVPILHDEMARGEAAGGRTRRERSRTSPAATSTGPRPETYYQPSSSAADMARQIETAAGGSLQTPIPILAREKRKARKSVARPNTPLDSPPLLRPLVSPPSYVPPPSPSPSPSTPSAPTTPTTPTTPTRSKFPPLPKLSSLLSLAPAGRDRSHTVPTRQIPQPKDLDKSGEDGESQWLSPRSSMLGFCRKPGGSSQKPP